MSGHCGKCGRQLSNTSGQCPTCYRSPLERTQEQLARAVELLEHCDEYNAPDWCIFKVGGKWEAYTDRCLGREFGSAFEAFGAVKKVS